MPEAIQALCFYAGANSIFYGDKLLTTGNPAAERDRALMDRLGLYPMQPNGEGRREARDRRQKRGERRETGA
jgi:biotin synthase